MKILERTPSPPDAPAPRQSPEQLEAGRPLGSTAGSFLLPSVTGIQRSRWFAERGGGPFKGTGAFVKASRPQSEGDGLGALETMQGG